MTGGLTVVDLTASRRPPPPPQVLILAALDADDRPVADGAALAAPVKALSFAFRSPTFLAEEKTRFIWRLVGHDDRWSQPSRQATVRFTNLLPGHYEFQVEAVSAAGLHSPQPATFRIRVAVPWYLGALAALVTLGVVTGAGAAIAHWRTRAIRRRNLELERVVAERTEQLADANRRLAHLASIDALTGLANYRVLHERLEREWLRALRESSPLSLIMLDIDFFKPYNDTFGHQQGDECLRRVSSVISAHASRPADIAARYGGEEFVVLLADTPEDGAESVAEKVRAAVEELAIPHPGSAAAEIVTVSLGVATRRPGPGREADELITAADRALYRAKREGRNRVVSASLP
jgi:diguanylate cyclase (GGDEF)-like protein